MKKVFLIMFLIVFLQGCSFEEKNEFNVSFSNVSHDFFYSYDKNMTLENISFFLSNNENFNLDCQIFLNMSNETNSTRVEESIGNLNPGQKKKAYLVFNMFSGNATLSIAPVCTVI